MFLESTKTSRFSLLFLETSDLTGFMSGMSRHVNPHPSSLTSFFQLPGPITTTKTAASRLVTALTSADNRTLTGPKQGMTRSSSVPCPFSTDENADPSLLKLNAVPVCKRKAKLVQNHQPGHIIASSCTTPNIRGPDKPPPRRVEETGARSRSQHLISATTIKPRRGIDSPQLHHPDLLRPKQCA